MNRDAIMFFFFLLILSNLDFRVPGSMTASIKSGIVRLTLLGVGAMNSPRFAPTGLLAEHKKSRVIIDAGPGARLKGRFDAWLVTDEQGELMREIRTFARAK